jgi:hypothetical protein
MQRRAFLKAMSGLAAMSGTTLRSLGILEIEAELARVRNFYQQAGAP